VQGKDGSRHEAKVMLLIDAYWVTAWLVVQKDWLCQSNGGGVTLVLFNVQQCCLEGSVNYKASQFQ